MLAMYASGAVQIMELLEYLMILYHAHTTQALVIWVAADCLITWCILKIVRWLRSRK